MILSVLFLSLLTVTPVFAQELPRHRMPQDSDRFFGPPVFLYDVYYFKSTTDHTMTRAKVFISFCNDILQFVKKSDTHFEAQYELLIAIFDKKGNHLSGKTMTEEITVKSFPETNLRTLTNHFHHVVDLIADKYKLIIELTDIDTKKTLHREKTLELTEFKYDSVGISNVIFSDDVQNDSSVIIPNLNQSFTNSEANFGTYFEIYPQNLKDSLTIIYKLLDSFENPVLTKAKTLLPQNIIIPYRISLKDKIDRAGRYTLAVEVTQKFKKKKVEEKFSTNWNYHKFSNLNINQAIEPLKELVKEDDWKWLEQENDSAKKVWFENYWKQRDPTPETAENELMDEYYKRVDFTNFHFTVNNVDKDGWETDRGKIYVKYGPPDSVDRYTNELNVPPYEIWYYASIDRRFIFEDRSGIGDYTLVKIE